MRDFYIKCVFRRPNVFSREKRIPITQIPADIFNIHSRRNAFDLFVDRSVVFLHVQID
jgi:hypothetical protein